MTVPRPLGPGDDDGKDRGTALPVRPPLSAGDSDGKDRGTAAAVAPPAAPGDGEASEWDMRPPRPLGPGDLQVPQSAVRVKRKTTGA